MSKYIDYHRAFRLMAVAVYCAVLVLGSYICSHAQIIQDDPPRTGQSWVYLHWNLEGDSTDATISEWILPVTGMVPLAENTELRYFASLAGASASAATFERDLSGLTDSRIQISRALADDQFLVSFGINLPTGKNKLDQDQFEVLRVLSDEYYNFPLKSFGEGLNLYSEVLGAAFAGEWIVGGGLGVSYHGSYEPTDNGVSYQPGMRFYLTGSAEIVFNEQYAERLRFDGVLTVAAADQADDQDVFKDGPWVDLSASGTRKFGDWLGGADVRLILRGKDERVIDGGSLVAEEYASTGSEFRLRVQAARELTERLSGVVDVSTKFVGANSYPSDDLNYEGSATLFGLGGQVNGRLSKRIRGVFGLRKWFGSSDAGGRTEALDLSGWEIRQSLTMTF